MLYLVKSCDLFQLHYLYIALNADLFSVSLILQVTIRNRVILLYSNIAENTMFAHSQANIVNGVENVAFVKYKGDKSHLARTEEDSTKRHFHTFDVEQSTGAKITDHTNATPRYRTFEDTEAKLFKVWKVYGIIAMKKLCICFLSEECATAVNMLQNSL